MFWPDTAIYQFRTTETSIWKTEKITSEKIKGLPRKQETTGQLLDDISLED